MATPIKSNDTQEGCNPVSSNCVIWQGPDIPCINLCHGDSVSDVVAKLAEKLCTVLDQLDMTVYDLSCFDPLCPNPQNLQELIQFILNKVCDLSQQNGGTVTPGCPDCEVTIAPCFQEPDFLGNLIVSLQLKDYVIKIGNEICTILSTIATIQNGLAALDTRVTYIEDNCCNTGPTNITVGTASCLSGVSGLSIVDFAVQLETAFCALQARTGTPLAIYDAIGYECVGLRGLAPLDPAQTAATMSAIPGWTVGAQTLAASFTNMWITVCDMRAAIADLQTALAACCSVTCADINWGFTATGVFGAKFIRPTFTGLIPAGYNYCSGSTTNITVTNALGGSANFAEDVIDSINNGTVIDLDVSSAPTVTEYSIWYELQINLCITDGTTSCTTVESFSFYSPYACGYMNPNITSSSTTSVEVNWQSLNLPTSYTIKLYNSSGVQINSYSVSFSVLGPRSWTFNGLTPTTLYSAEIVATQNGYSTTCSAGGVVTLTPGP
jgi:hypothetical protein